MFFSFLPIITLLRPANMFHEQETNANVPSIRSIGIICTSWLCPSTAIEKLFIFPDDTVDRRNPAPVEVGSLSHDLQGLSTIQPVVGRMGFLSHQQYPQNSSTRRIMWISTSSSRESGSFVSTLQRSSWAQNAWESYALGPGGEKIIRVVVAIDIPLINSCQQ